MAAPKVVYKANFYITAVTLAKLGHLRWPV